MKRNWKVAFLALAVLLVGAAVYASLRTWQYVEHDPAFCRSCHLMEEAWNLWRESPHARVECHACHRQSLAENLEQLFKFVLLRPETISKHAEVDHTRCAACHLAQDPRWPQVAATAGHAVHFGRLGIECVVCHSKGVHRFVRPTDSCRECHADIVVRASGMEELHCTACHRFLAPGTELRPVRSECLDCHETRPGLEPEKHGPMEFRCTECHRPHEKPLPSSEDCRRCHSMGEYGLHAIEAHRECTTCHPAHTWKPAERENCEACHVDRSDHYPELPCAGCHSFGP